MAQNGEMLGTIDDNGRIRTLRGHGPSLVAIAGHDRQISQRKRMRRTLVTRYVILAPAMSFVPTYFNFNYYEEIL